MVTTERRFLRAVSILAVPLLCCPSKLHDNSWYRGSLNLGAASVTAFIILVFSLSVPSLATSQQESWEDLTSKAKRLYQQGRYAEAIPIAQQALRVAEAKFNPDDIKVAPLLDNLGALYWANAQYGEAEPLLKRALSVREKILGPEPPTLPYHWTTWRQSMQTYADTEMQKGFMSVRSQ